MASLIFLQGCAGRKPVPVGFAGRLTGAQSDLGIQIRNGVQLAVEDVNASGGINGRPIELIIRNDEGTPKGAISADRQLIDAGVVAIIGHVLSTETGAALPTINKARIVIISPSASSPKLTELSPYYFQVNPRLQSRLPDFARYIYQTRGMKTLAITYDTDNPVFTRSYYDLFSSAYRKLGGKVTGVVAFSFKSKPNFNALVKQLRAGKQDGLLIIASSPDTAIISQQTRLIGWNVALFSSFWADLDVVNTLGGRAVQGMALETSFNVQSKSPKLQNFIRRYRAKYGPATSFESAIGGYETLMLLAEVLKKTNGSKEGLRKALLDIKSFEGLIDTFHFDKNHGAVRPSYVRIIRPGGAIIIRTGTPQS
jgi:branched-chain amino acid transport system substrate-binding protein